MVQQKMILAVVFGNASILATGILIVLIACFQYNNFFPLLTILANLVAIAQLMMCGSCNTQPSYYNSDDSQHHVSWLLFGLCIVIGYAIPSLLYRANQIPEIALYFSWIGGTTILTSMIIYMRIIYNRHEGM